MTTWTHTADVVRQALDSLKPTGGTAVYDAVLEALPLIARRNRERGALLIVSDGADTASTAKLERRAVRRCGAARRSCTRLRSTRRTTKPSIAA